MLNVKYPKTKLQRVINYIITCFESTLNAKRLCHKNIKLRGGFCVMVKY